MAVVCNHEPLSARAWRPRLLRANLSHRKRVALLVAINLLVFAAFLLIAEIVFRSFWNPRYWIHTDRFLVGSGQTEAGKKWWPDTTFSVDSSEFRLKFHTDASGYRVRSQGEVGDRSRGAAMGLRPYRIAFVGDSFTEAMQVPYDASFCARLEGLLNRVDPPRPFACENFGVSATDLFDYWHRMIHDVLPVDPPDALILCIYPGNDFQGPLPDDGFDVDGRPLREYFKRPGWIKHTIAWINLHSEFGFFLQRSLLVSWDAKSRRAKQGPKNWWTDPILAERAANEPALRRSRSLFRAMDEECRSRGTKLCILVVGPVANYAAKDGQSPLGRILTSWGINIPVIDLAIKARSRSDWDSLVFPYDGHLNESGHAFLAAEAAPPLLAILSDAVLTSF